ncbi:uncharacterized protein BKA78DRAFT_123776 [Phyllosticta capitalensis]|uniref:uncharacterized protein n=1 Tax=Phyllosticta capitalensis TaxID=121624 RepID=UPI00312E1AF8
MFILGWTFASMSFICVCVSDDEPVHPLAQRQRHRVADIVSQFAFGRGPYRQADGRIAAAVTAAAEASTRSAGRFLHRGSTAHTSSGVRIWGRAGQMGDVCRCEDMTNFVKRASMVDFILLSVRPRPSSPIRSDPIIDFINVVPDLPKTKRQTDPFSHQPTKQAARKKAAFWKNQIVPEPPPIVAQERAPRHQLLQQKPSS